MPTPERSQSPSPSAIPSPNVQAAASSSLANEHLSYPSASTPAAQTPPASTKPRPLLQDRLYVGNLHPSVDEYTLLQVFSKFGKVSKLDFLFHKSGPMKGKPRGYAFVEFASKDDADKALTHANDKLLRGRKLVVTYAHQAPLDQAGAGGKYRRVVSEVGKPTTLSLLKSVGGGRSDATEAKIAKMEAKLRQMETAPVGSLSAGSSLAHPSLPPKPISLPSAPSSSHHKPSARLQDKRPLLPSLPLAHPSTPPLRPVSSSAIAGSSSPRPHPGRKTASALPGVRIMKAHKGSNG